MALSTDGKIRLTEAPFPPYSYVPHMFPHPVREPQGHGYGQDCEHVRRYDHNHWRASYEHRRAVDLFNHGYYWEAHESWETLWHALGRVGASADQIKGLIKMAAAGVKAREGRPEGVARHAARARDLFAMSGVDSPSIDSSLGPCPFRQLQQFANEVACNPNAFVNDAIAPVVIVFPFVMRP